MSVSGRRSPEQPKRSRPPRPWRSRRAPGSRRCRSHPAKPADGSDCADRTSPDRGVVAGWRCPEAAARRRPCRTQPSRQRRCRASQPASVSRSSPGFGSTAPGERGAAHAPRSCGDRRRSRCPRERTYAPSSWVSSPRAGRPPLLPSRGRRPRRPAGPRRLPPRARRPCRRSPSCLHRRRR